MDTDAARSVAFHLRSASDFMREYAILKREGIDGATSLLLAQNNLKLAADELGLDLVLLLSPAAAHAACIARGHYFDGKSDCVTTGGPFDGRANAELANAEDGSIQGRG